MITQPGIYTVSHADYHADPCLTPSLSSSVAKTLLSRSPMHARMMHPKLNPTYVNAESSRFDLGAMAHAMLLEDDTSKLVSIDADDWRTKAAKEARDEARAAGKLPVLARHAADLLRMVSAARTFLSGSELKDFEWEAERTVVWQEDGIWCRSRPDWLSTGRDVILDYKTTDDANPEAFIRQIARMGYDTQAAFYSRGLQAVGSSATFAFLAQEIEPPYARSLVALSNTYLEIARVKVERAIKTWAYCLRNDDWPAYTDRILYAEPPQWELAKFQAGIEDEMGVWR
jgi:hypothetical protein